MRLLLSSFFAAVCFVQLAHAYLELPNWEVKLYLNASAVLTPEMKLIPDLKAKFEITESSIKMNMLFLDSTASEMNKQGWNVRLRRKEGESKAELTFKKRMAISVTPDRPIDDSIKEVVEMAEDMGFKSSDGFLTQVDWAYDSRALAMAFTKLVDPDRDPLPSSPRCKKYALDQMPQVLRRWIPAKGLQGPSWSESIITNAWTYGPVAGKRYTGFWAKMPLTVEVWFIATEDGKGVEPIVEVSVKTPSSFTAAIQQKAMADFLFSTGLGCPVNLFKTQLVLARYKPRLG